MEIVTGAVDNIDKFTWIPIKLNLLEVSKIV